MLLSFIEVFGCRVNALLGYIEGIPPFRGDIDLSFLYRAVVVRLG